VRRVGQLRDSRVRRRGGAFGHLAGIAVAVLGVLLAGSPAATAQGRHAVLVIDGNSGRVLVAEQADMPRYPASLTKMMTIYLALEQIEAGKLSPATRIKISQEAASVQPSKLDLEPGEQIALMDAIKALVTKSANDIAVAIAEHIAGSETAFAQLMTEKARQLGMNRTTFRNAHGLPHSEQVTTARDMITLAMRLHDNFPRHYPLFALRSFTYNGATYANHNTLLRSFEGTEGMKTGYTRISGFNVVTSVRRGGKHVFGAVFGGDTAGSRNAAMRTALLRALPAAATTRTRQIERTPLLIAETKAARRPATVAAAAPKPVIAVQRAAPAAPLAPSPVPAPSAAEDLPPASTGNRIAVAQVRKVMVATRPRALPNTETTEEVDEADAAVRQSRTPQFAAVGLLPPLPRPEPVQTPAALVAAADPKPQPVAAAPPRPRVSPPLQRPVATAQPPAPPTVALAAPAQPGRGLPPSTLQQQARGLAAPAPLVTSPNALRGPTPRPAQANTAGPGGVHLQIGAFNTQVEAERRLASVQAQAADLLAAAVPVTIPVQKDARVLYRARYAGMTATAAATTCFELRRQQIDCFVMKAEP